MRSNNGETEALKLYIQSKQAIGFWMNVDYFKLKPFKSRENGRKSQIFANSNNQKLWIELGADMSYIYLSENFHPKYPHNYKAIPLS